MNEKKTENRILYQRISQLVNEKEIKAHPGLRDVLKAHVIKSMYGYNDIQFPIYTSWEVIKDLPNNTGIVFRNSNN